MCFWISTCARISVLISDDKDDTRSRVEDAEKTAVTKIVTRTENEMLKIHNLDYPRIQCNI